MRSRVARGRASGATGTRLFLAEAEGADVVPRVQRDQARRLAPSHLRRHPDADLSRVNII